MPVHSCVALVGSKNCIPVQPSPSPLPSKWARQCLFGRHKQNLKSNYINKQVQIDYDDENYDLDDDDNSDSIDDDNYQQNTEKYTFAKKASIW